MDKTTMINAARRGDLNAFNELVLLHQDFLFGVAVRILGDEDSATDAVQETLISAFRNLNTFRGESIINWLARIVVNFCYDELRRKHRRRTVPLEQVDEYDEIIEPGLWMADPIAGPEERYESHELERAIEACLQLLPPAYRVVFVLVDIENRSYEETAAILGILVNTVKSRLARARMRMTQDLQKFKDQLPAHYRISFSHRVQADVSLPVCE